MLFFERNRKLFLSFKYFIYLVGIVVIILFILEFASRALLEKEFLEKDKQEWELLYYEPYLDFSIRQRETKNPCKDMLENPLLIYTFGGSTMWGANARYDETIASYVSDLLCKEQIPVEVKNFGVPGQVNTQQVIKLFLELGDGKVPDIVIFYDGFNDINTRGYSYETPQVFKYLVHHMDYQRSIFPKLKEYISKYFGGIDPSLNLKDEVLDGYFSKFQLRTHGLYGEELYEKVMEIYLNNVKIVKSMEKGLSFKSFFYWQPTLYQKIGNLSDEEEMLYKYLDILEQLERLKIADSVITKFLKDSEHVRDLRKIFSHRSDNIFVDSCHILSENNKIIAEKMVEDIIKHLEEGYYEQK